MKKHTGKGGPAAATLAVLLIAGPGFLLAGGCASKTLEGPILLHPIPPAADHYAMEAGAIVFTGPGFTAAARPLDWRVVEQCYGDAGLPLPLGDGEGALSPYLFFSVRLENDSTAHLNFSPLRASLFPGRKVPLSPIEVSDVYLIAAGTPDHDRRLAAFTATAFDAAVTVAPGTYVEKYLIFPSPREKTKTVALVLNDLYLANASFDPVFTFEVFPGAFPE